jgi:hypothetical protein
MPSGVPPDVLPESGEPPPGELRATSGEFIMGGSLTPLADSTGGRQDAPGVPPTAMPGFHHRKEVQLVLRRLRNGVSLWGRILAGPADGPRHASQRFMEPHHTMYIK